MTSLFPAGPTDAKARAVKVKQWLSAAAAANADIDATQLDVAALAARLGPDPEAAYRWVRDHTSFVPYRGALRGPRGTLVDRTGNSLDRALLLHALLKAGHHKARLARGKLPEARAREALAAVRAPEQAPPGAPPAELAPRYAKASGLDEGEIRSAMDRWAAAQEQAKKGVLARADLEVPAITKLLGAAQAAKPEPDRASAVEDHWWVQVERDGAFVDLDPTLPGAQPGQALTTSTETRDPGRLDDLGGEVHRVQITVTVERWKDGALAESAALRRKVTPGDLAGTPITLTHAPSEWPEHFDMAAPDVERRLRELVLAQHEWTPVLTVGSERVVQSAFTAAGTLTSPPAPKGGGGPGLGGLFGNALAGSGNNPPPADPAQADTGRLTAEWIDYEIEVPGQPTRKVRREIFDLIGPAARRAGKVPEPALGDARRLQRGLGLLGEHQMLVMGARLSADLVSHLSLAALAANADGLARIAGTDLDQASPDTVFDMVRRLGRLPGPLLDLAADRSAFSPHGSEVYLDRPNVLGYHTLLAAGERGELSLVEGYDLVTNEVAVRPGVKDPARVRLEQGIFDSNLESALLQIRSSGVHGDAPVENAADLLRQEGEGWLLVRTASDPGWRAASVPPDLRARVELELAAGWSVLVPGKPIRAGGRETAGFWHVHPDTGDILGMGARGWGEAAVEYSLLDKLVGMGAAGALVGFPVALLCQSGYEGNVQTGNVVVISGISPYCKCLGILGGILAGLALVAPSSAFTTATTGAALGAVCASKPTTTYGGPGKH